ncbi:MAG: DUF2244 domain-containing protein [Hyphomicrobiales bacterium]|nr:DUF2244 domain-containing protein [Hyphomicrobiales bacterium]
MDGDTLFSTELRPHRSARLRSLQTLVLLIAVVWFVVGLAFAIAGAWPIIGFLGAEVLLLYGALVWNLRAGSAHEVIDLTADALTVRRVNHWGQRQDWTFQPYWLRVELEHPPGRSSRLTIASHGRRLVIGAFLPPREREDLAERLRGALLDLRAGPVQPDSPSTSTMA